MLASALLMTLSVSSVFATHAPGAGHHGALAARKCPPARTVTVTLTQSIAPPSSIPIPIPSAIASQEPSSSIAPAPVSSDPPAPASSLSPSSSVPVESSSSSIPVRMSTSIVPVRTSTSISKSATSTSTSASSTSIAVPTQSPAPNPTKGLISNYSGPFSGDGTAYGDSDSGNNCLFQPRTDKMFAAFPGSQWANGAQCGACVNVVGPAGNVNVQITNQCPECAAGSLDLSDTAFRAITGTAPSRVKISWSFVNCKDVGLVTAAPSIVWKSGSSQYWAAVQLRNSPTPVQSIAYLKAGAFVNLERQSFNFYQSSSGLGSSGPYTFRVTLQDGTVTDFPNVQLNSVVVNL